MRVFVIRHKGHHLGGITLVMAPNKRDAKRLFETELGKRDFVQYIGAKYPVADKDTLIHSITEYSTDKKGLYLLWNGDY